MFAVTAARVDADDPLSGLELGEHPDPEPPEGWTTVEVRAASLNHHDLWTLRGVGIGEDRLPIVLGCDAAGVDADGDDVIVHSVISPPGWLGDETLDPARSLLSERHDGTFADRVAVPRRNLVPKPAALSFEEAACLPTAWLTAYRMLFVNAGVEPGATVLVQGAGGGVSTALVLLGRAAGYRVWVTGRSDEKRARALELGADAAFEPGGAAARAGGCRVIGRLRASVGPGGLPPASAAGPSGAKGRLRRERFTSGPRGGVCATRAPQPDKALREPRSGTWRPTAAVRRVREESRFGRARDDRAR